MPPIPTPFQATAPVEAARGLDHWEHLTRATLNAHRDGRLEIALAGHVRALWTAEARRQWLGLAGGPGRRPACGGKQR
ncbi:MAG: hypothetical protein REU00_24360, partial [Pseudomonadota bacterium]|nr:hypothetical protein [Pseudomonadota bacterium]